MPKVGSGNGNAKRTAADAVLAVNVFDVGRADPALRAALLAGKLLPEPVRLSRRGDDVAVAFACADVEAALAVDLLRDADRRVGDRPCRAAIRRRGRWEPLPDGAVLTCRVGGEVRLSALWFPPQEARAAKAIEHNVSGEEV